MSFYGCCCDPHTSQVCASISGLCSGGNANGTAFNISGPGGFTGSHTLSGGATSFCWTGLAYGSYVVTITAVPTGYAMPSPATRTVTVSSGTPSGTAGYTLTLAAGYQCTGPICGVCSGTPPFLSSSLALWPTLFLNDGVGTISLTGSGSGSWTGSATRTAAADCNTTSVPVTVYFEVICGTSTWQVNAGVGGCTSTSGPFIGTTSYRFPGSTTPIQFISGITLGSPACPTGSTSGSGDFSGYRADGTFTDAEAADALGHVYGFDPSTRGLNLSVTWTS